MVMKPEPIFAALEAVRAENAGPVILMEPWGEPLNQSLAAELAAEQGLIVVCGRYEGIDDRVRQALADREISIGDYVLSGGEVAALVVVETVARMLPGTLGSPESLEGETFSGEDAFEPPLYTRPADFDGRAVPEVLRNGNHAAIERWRREQAEASRHRRIPDPVGAGVDHTSMTRAGAPRSSRRTP